MEATASGVFCSRMMSMVNREDVNAIVQAQRHMLDRFEKTNEMLLNFNGLSSARLHQMTERYQHHTRTLVEMKKDLDSIFRRIRTLKGKLAKQYPEAFSSVHESPMSEDEDFEPLPRNSLVLSTASCPSSESSDTSPTLLSTGASGDSEDASHGPPDLPIINGQISGRRQPQQLPPTRDRGRTEINLGSG
ncbi:kxDL motif-containing protein 1 [Callorhinchus milii]|uniref:KxDL motif-containing protein 1 n=1 Tax=Callorhinchus milii TaxID=7868 RepID=V9L944_CALMI|nr:kxDL motif-containing protein 1 [Callorhinchus milii]|eukprot:gi/632962057/ref/XP_007897099.1/ PREDICTED: kxDL motif-containing protein 1 [Callorhinchus milii]